MCLGIMTRKFEVALDIFELQDKGSVDGEFNLEDEDMDSRASSVCSSTVITSITSIILL